jgi:hypothetical protein
VGRQLAVGTFQQASPVASGHHGVAPPATQPKPAVDRYGDAQRGEAAASIGSEDCTTSVRQTTPCSAARSFSNPAGLDRGELVIVPDQLDAAAAPYDGRHRRSRVSVSANPASSMTTGVRDPNCSGRGYDPKADRHSGDVTSGGDRS